MPKRKISRREGSPTVAIIIGIVVVVVLGTRSYWRGNIPVIEGRELERGSRRVIEIGWNRRIAGGEDLFRRGGRRCRRMKMNRS